MKLIEMKGISALWPQNFGLANSRRKLTAQTFGYDEASGLQDAPDTILQYRDLRDKLSPRHQQRTHDLTRLAFDHHLAVPADAHDLGQAVGIVGIRLVDLQRQGCSGVAGIDTNNPKNGS